MVHVPGHCTRFRDSFLLVCDVFEMSIIIIVCWHASTVDFNWHFEVVPLCVINLMNFVLCLKLRGHWTESHQIFTRCTEMTADYYAEIKIAIFQFVSERQGDE